MALIICPECKKEISDKADVCIHCGFPIKTFIKSSTPNSCNINGTIYNLTKVYNAIPVTKDEYSKMDKISRIKNIGIVANNILSTIQINNLAASYLAGQILELGAIPQEFDAEQYANQDKQNQQAIQRISQIRCPHCGSTSITTGARGVNWTLGLIGASKTVNRCAKCGHTWTPHK